MVVDMEVIMEAVEAIKEVGMVVVLVAAVVVGMDITNMAVVVGQVRRNAANSAAFAFTHGPQRQKQTRKTTTQRTNTS